MNKISILKTCNITTGKKDSNEAVDNGKYPFFTCAPEALRINTYCFDGDVILLAGNNAGGNFHCQRYSGKFDAYQRTYILTAKEGYDIDFIYYSLILNLKQYTKKSQGSQTKFLTMKILNDFEIDDIPYLEQKRLSNHLKKIDKKIENNNKINKELESMAKALYDYWFLQFEFPDEEGKPYKSSSGKMVWNEKLKREIPEGWEVKKLSDIIKLENEKNYVGPDTKTIDLSVMPSNSIAMNEINCSSNFETNLFEMKKGDILFGSIRPYLKKAGIAPCDGAFAGTVLNFRCINENHYNYALLTICHDNMFDYAVKNSKGTKMPVVGSGSILEYPIPFNDKVVREFNRLDIKNIICKNVMENQELSSLRNFLLPLLMNGQVSLL